MLTGKFETSWRWRDLQTRRLHYRLAGISGIVTTPVNILCAILSIFTNLMQTSINSHYTFYLCQLTRHTRLRLFTSNASNKQFTYHLSDSDTHACNSRCCRFVPTPTFHGKSKQKTGKQKINYTIQTKLSFK